jgi:UDP-glucose 4-epimerase
MPTGPLIDEDAPTAPINPYGETKLVSEWLLRSVGTACGLSWISLRYFNVAGSAHASLAERGGTGLFQTAFRQALAGRPVQVTGSDFPTRDGTGVRDYVHVVDVAMAHAAAIRHLTTERCADTFNVGTGSGHSVLEVLDEIGCVTGMTVRRSMVGRRPCDPATAVASVERIRRQLGWQARYGLSDMVRSTWHAMSEARSPVQAR